LNPRVLLPLSYGDVGSRRLSSMITEAEAVNNAAKEDGSPASAWGSVTQDELRQAEEVALEEEENNDLDPEIIDPEIDPLLIASKSQQVCDAQIEALAKRGIHKFTEIQALSFDAIYQGRDLLGKSRTGTGKTIAFGLPLIEQLGAKKRQGLYKQTRGQGPAIVVLAPTRELAKQVETELSSLSAVHGLRTTCFHGGVSYVPQERALRNGVDILVATVGRVIDHLDRGNLDLSNAYHLVLDEADEMLSMGFADDVEKIFSFTPAAKRGKHVKHAEEEQAFLDDLLDEELGGDPIFSDQPQNKNNFQTRTQNPFVDANDMQVQTLLFSATTPKWIKQLTKRYLVQPKLVDVVGDDRNQGSTTVTHKAVLVPREARASLLEDIIQVEVSNQAGQESDAAVAGGGRVIVFASTKKECDELAGGQAFKRLGAQVLHGDIGQSQREATLAQFRRGAFTVLVATDVAARGIDVRGVDLVVQYRIPRDAEGYIHRSGRTGRAGRDGTAVVLYDDREERDIKDLEQRTNIKFMRQGPPAVPAVLDAAARDATLALTQVQDDIVPYFQDHAARLIEQFQQELNTTTLVAKCLAAVARKNHVTRRSLLTGAEDTTTIMITAPRALKTGDVVFAVSKLLERIEDDQRAAEEDDDVFLPKASVGVVKICQDTTKAVFDLEENAAKRLLEFVQTQNLQRFAFEECAVLPPIQTRFDSAPRGGGGYRGEKERGRGRGGGGGYRGQSNRGRGGYDNRSGDRGGRYSGDRRGNYQDRSGGGGGSRYRSRDRY